MNDIVRLQLKLQLKDAENKVEQLSSNITDLLSKVEVSETALTTMKEENNKLQLDSNNLRNETQLIQQQLEAAKISLMQQEEENYTLKTTMADMSRELFTSIVLAVKMNEVNHNRDINCNFNCCDWFDEVKSEKVPYKDWSRWIMKRIDKESGDRECEELMRSNQSLGREGKKIIVTNEGQKVVNEVKSGKNVKRQPNAKK